MILCTTIGTTLQRDVLVPKKPSYADSVVIPSPPTKVFLPAVKDAQCGFYTQTHFLVENEEIKLSQRLEQMTVVTNVVCSLTDTVTNYCLCFSVSVSDSPATAEPV